MLCCGCVKHLYILANNMKINKNSWHYKVVRFTYSGSIEDNCKDLCTYMRRLLLVAPLYAFLLVIFYAFLALIVIPIMTLCGLIMGIRPTRFEPAFDNYVSYSGLPIGSFRLYPWHLIAPSFFIIFNVLGFHRLGAMWSVPALMQFMIVAIPLFFLRKPNKKDKAPKQPSLLRAWFTAKKEKVCPIIEYTDGE